MHVLQCSPTSVGLTQARPNKTFEFFLCVFHIPNILVTCTECRCCHTRLSHLFRKHIHSDLIVVSIAPELYLGEYLVGEGVAHHKAGVASGTAQVHQPALSQQQDMPTIGKFITIHLKGKK